MKRRLPPLNAIRAFESAARLSSITDAADELSVTPTAISHQIRHLESLLDVKLFERTGRNIKLTAQGERILPEVTLGMDSLAAAFEEVYGTIDRNTINISTTREFARYWLQPRLGDFYQRFPGHTLNISTSEKCAALDGSEVDLVVRYGPKPAEVEEGKARAKDQEICLFQEHYLAAVSKSLVDTDNSEPHINDLSSLRLIDIRWEKSSLLCPSWKKWFEIEGIDNFNDYQHMSFDAYNLAFDSLKRGFGAALLSRTIIDSEEFCEQLVCLKGPELPGYYYRIINTASGSRKVSVQDFIDWILEQVNKG